MTCDGSSVVEVQAEPVEMAMPFSKGHTPAEARNRPEFLDHFNALWHELEADVRV